MNRLKNQIITKMENCTIGFIGGGNMSSAIARGIIKNDAHDISKIWVSGPHIENLKHWKEMGIDSNHITTQNGELFKNCDIVFLGVKPVMFDTVAKNIVTVPGKGKSTLVVSMLAGVEINRMRQGLNYCDVIGIVRIMPNTPMYVGKGVCLYTPDNVAITECSQLTTVLVKLLEASSVCEKVPEKLIGTLGVLTGCGPAYIYMVIEALADGAVKQGVPRDLATRFASQMVIGSGHMVVETGKHPGLLKDEVCSPGGSTICGVAALENGNLRASFINAIEASTMKNAGK